MDQQQLSYKEMPLKTECHIDCSPVVLISFMFFQSAFILQLLYGQSQGALSIKQPSKFTCKSQYVEKRSCFPEVCVLQVLF